ncbi:Gfo/Idh/MocA family protein [Actinacidiphila bryophytorum]|nr:hypothetical protein [Actinacidiphila bryophytorum]MBM9438366.1 hypothetical protein [Actinacidiphila bryophytorum]MBN6543659.1 hypothetical protein [Actinacidiphila bryophytorum]
MTTRYDQTVALLGLARSCGKVLMENVMFVHHPQHSTVRRPAAGGVSGELRSVRAEFTVPRRPAGDIGHEPQLGGGALWDTGVYPVRAALHLLGPDLGSSPPSSRTAGRTGWTPRARRCCALRTG